MNEEYGEDMRNEFKHLENIVRIAKAGVLVSEVKVTSSSPKKCRYWNKGYCREGSSNCPFYHPPDDWRQHLQEGCCSSQGCALRHRKRCKYFETQAGCFRKGQCQYLHVDYPAREAVNTEKEEEVTVIKLMSKCVLEKDSNMEAEEDIGEPDKASSKDEEKIEEKMCDTAMNVEKEIEIKRKHLKCDFCKYKCKNKKILTKHLDSNHGDHNKCFICETRFSTAETLKTHVDMHTDDEMFDSLNRLCDSVTKQ